MQFMLTNDDTGVHAWRCPNKAVCNGITMKSLADLHNQCPPGYNSLAPGCAKCNVTGYGRSAADPLVCERCPGLVWKCLSWLRFVGQPCGLYALGLFAGLQQPGRGNSAAILKIFISAALISAQTVGVLEASTGYRLVRDHWIGAFIDTSSKVAKSAWVTESLDCLTNTHSRVYIELVACLTPPILAIISSVLVCKGGGRAEILIVSVLVAGNVWLSPMLPSAS